MTITGQLSEFSLPELFQFLEQGQKTGLLTLNSMIRETKKHYIWFRQGRIIAASDRNDQQGLLTLIQKRGWLKNIPSITEEQLQTTPVGLYFKANNLLQAEQLKLLFYAQVMQQVCALFELPDAHFAFETNTPIPSLELTGLSSPGAEVTLAGLRALRSWSALQDKLPETNSALTSRNEGKPSLHLNQSEWKVWEFTDGNVTLKAIAEQLQIPVEQIQQIAFRLIVVNLVEELPMVVASANPIPPINSLEFNSEEAKTSTSNHPSGLSAAFLENLMSFLQGKA
ncbi:hypothetical protein C7H19_14475 [Aphanothece hegewaldii CCALA 016]|uniref:PatA-like N-terminal domain-containing protein n=1 Tax=Aphanothece hegewaldii CCALA 016 TaxID=2107694 RepID=A0A2T1LWL2_9CHRO|nr:DUF4388 domain-containing protein [Aphanothece hegewaldii]PSF36198.1 hypothetical protein C7H19_14475 [Aphanothece hegewaldii CCALA 016]